jgi:hypothetical protein
VKHTILTAGLTCVCVALSGCATPTPYQSSAFAGGYSETQLSSNVFKVYFRGNGYTGDERAADFTLMRSAELASAHGFAYFIIVDEHSGESYSTVTTPATTYTTTNVTAIGDDTAHGTSISTTVGGESYVIRKPSKQNTIVCFTEKPPVQGVVYESQFVVRSIRTKYGMKPEQFAATNPALAATDAASTNAASASNWVPYTSNVAGELIDFDSIKVSGNVRRAWFKSTSVSATMKGLPPQLTAGVDYVLALNEFSCNDKKFRILGVSFHNMDTDPSSDSSNSSAGKWAPVAPDSVADAAMNYLCKLNL